MSPVALALDLLLGSLLVLTLVLGVRLNSRLKGLKQSHAGFEKAVAELNHAAARAEAGLAALRETSAEAHDALLARIDTARTLVTRLERANFQAEKAAEAVVKAKAELPSLATSRAEATASRFAPPTAPTPTPRMSSPLTSSPLTSSPLTSSPLKSGVPMSDSLATIAALVGHGPRGAVHPTSPDANPAPTSGGTPPGGSARRGRPAFDEDLFESDEDAPPASSLGLRGRFRDDRR